MKEALPVNTTISHYRLLSRLGAGGMGEVYLAGVVPPREVWPSAKVALEKAVSLDETLAEAHTALGGLKVLFEWDWPGGTGGV